uniref:PGC-1 and ERR-induced regulator in muscle protein 1 n=1 Tax=Cyclopterus lumpus TaxID=8103 RepID=A0A8C2Z8H2_CYCLU
MDDLDHSIHIAECDWTRFHEESDQCCLPQPSLACPDSSNLSDSEDSGNSSSVFGAVQKGNSDDAESSAAECCMEEENYSGCVKYISGQIIQSGTGGGEDDPTTKAEMSLDLSVETPINTTEHITEDNITPTLQTEQLNVQYSDEEPSELKKEDGDVQMESDIREFQSIQKRDPFSCNRGEIHVNESHTSDRAVSEDVIGCALRGEKEHWFVTVNDNPAQQRLHAASVKRKEKQTKNRQDNNMCRPGQERYLEKGLKLQIIQVNYEFEGGTDTEYVTQKKRNSVVKSGGYPSDEDDPEMGIVSDASQMSLTSDEEDSLSEKLVTSHFPKYNVIEPMMDRISQDTLTAEDPSQSDSVESDELEDAVEFLSTHSFDTESYLLSASRCSSGDHLLPVPDLTVTPCSVADSPETYAEAAGHTRPVYAISAFWAEMEKLTINDILQLRMGQRTPPRETQETMTPNTDDLSSLDDAVEHNLSDGGLMDTSDAADSDYFTQPDESKPDRSSCEFSTPDIEEEYWQFLGASRNPSPDPQSKKRRSTSDSPVFVHEEEESTSSRGKETPVPSEDFVRKGLEDKDSNALISSQLARPRQMTKCKSVHNVQALNTEDLSLQLLLGNDETGLFLSSSTSLEENMFLKAHEKENTKSDFCCVSVYEPEDISVAPVIDYPLWIFRDEMSVSSLHELQRREGEPIPIFSCSHPTVRELTFPNPRYVFLSRDCEEEDGISPIRVISRSFIRGSGCGAAVPHGFHCWKSLMWKIRFLDKGSIWCRRSGAWVFPVEVEKITIKTSDPPITALTERRVSSPPSQLFRELAVQQRRKLNTCSITGREGIFSTLKQSDMCLVCIAFASWVLKSSDPEAADAWKAALLANLSALSAIQYLRKYVKKKNPS